MIHLNIKKFFIGAGIVATVVPISMAVSCGINQTPNPKPLDNKTYFKEFSNMPPQTFKIVNGMRILSVDSYNSFINKANSLYKNKNYLIFSVIASKNIYLEILPYSNQKKVIDAMQELQNIQFKFHNVGAGLGAFIQTFKIKTQDKWSDWMHGESKAKNYNDYYPLYEVNHVYAPLGVSNMSSQKEDIYEISYDHN